MNKYLAVVVLLFPVTAFAVKIATIEVLWGRGQASLLEKNYEKAFISCNQGLVELGNTYFMNDTVDDTGQKLALAEFNAAEGNYKIAASISCNALKTRLFLFKRKFGLINNEMP